jgi:hypothetical protein
MSTKTFTHVLLSSDLSRAKYHNKISLEYNVFTIFILIGDASSDRDFAHLKLKTKY